MRRADRAARNATTHAAFCHDLLHESESADLFDDFRHAVLEDLDPRTILELALADRVVAAQWRLRPCQTVEARLLDLEAADLDADIDDHNRRAADVRVKFDADDDQDGGADALTADHPDLAPIAPPDHPLSPGFYLARSLRAAATDPSPRTRTTPFERLVATEQRLQGMLHRALKELRACQAARRARAAHPDPTRPRPDAQPVHPPTQGPRLTKTAKRT